MRSVIHQRTPNPTTDHRPRTMVGRRTTEHGRTRNSEPGTRDPIGSMRKILIANRGEIAVRDHPRVPRDGHRAPSRCIRNATGRRCTSGSPTRRVPIGPARRARATCASSAIIDAARRAGADAVHPGYGFLAENEDFAAAVPRRRADLHRSVARGDRADGQQDRGAQAATRPACRSCRARRPARRDVSDADIAAIANAIGYPLLVKAVAGGGGKGMRDGRPTARICRAPFAPRARRRAPAFGDSAVYLERRLTRPRHIEVQLLGDQPRHGPAVRRTRMLDSAAASEGRRGDAVAGRDAGAARRDDVGGGRGRAGRRLHQCRHDRVPARRGRPVLFPRDEHAASGRASDHRDGHRRRSGALADPHRARRAAGCSIRSACWRRRGHAIECRIYAEDPDNGFLPSPGRIRAAARAVGPRHSRRQRRDGGSRRADLLRPDDLEAGRVGGRSAAARSRACAARSPSTSWPGIRTTLPFFTWLLDAARFRERARSTRPISTRFCRRATAGRSSSRRRRRGRRRRSRPPCRRCSGRRRPTAVTPDDARRRSRWKAQARAEGLRTLTCIRDRGRRAHATGHGHAGGRRALQSRSTGARGMSTSARIDAHTLSLLVDTASARLRTR